MMELNKKKTDEEYERLLKQYHQDIYDFASCKIEELNKIIKEQEEVLETIKK